MKINKTLCLDMEIVQEIALRKGDVNVSELVNGFLRDWLDIDREKNIINVPQLEKEVRKNIEIQEINEIAGAKIKKAKEEKEARMKVTDNRVKKKLAELDDLQNHNPKEYNRIMKDVK